MTATQNTLNRDFKVKDLSLADWERLYHELLERHPEALVLA